MGQLLYFVEKLEACSGQDLERLGLRYAFEGDGCATRRCSDGPGGQPGLVLGMRSEQLGYWRDAQTWQQLREGPPVVWVGWSTAAPPSPADFLRPTAIPGHEVQLADGQRWRVPIAFRLEGGTVQRALPSRMRLDPQGRWVSDDVLPRFKRLWEIACRWFDMNDPADSQQGLTVAEAADLCAEVLGVNYRLSRAEVGALGLLDDRDSIQQILNAVIDWPTYIAWVAQQKKTEANSAAAAG